jgi:hypothetical protein
MADTDKPSTGTADAATPDPPVGGGPSPISGQVPRQRPSEGSAAKDPAPASTDTSAQDAQERVRRAEQAGVHARIDNVEANISILGRALSLLALSLAGCLLGALLLLIIKGRSRGSP